MSCQKKELSKVRFTIYHPLPNPNHSFIHTFMPTEDYGAISMKQSQLRSNSAQTSGDSVNAPLLDSTTSVFSDDDEDATSPNKNSKNDSAATCVKFFINLLSIPSKAANALNFEGLSSSPNSNPFHSRYGGTENENR